MKAFRPAGGQTRSWSALILSALLAEGLASAATAQTLTARTHAVALQRATANFSELARREAFSACTLAIARKAAPRPMPRPGTPSTQLASQPSAPRARATPETLSLSTSLTSSLSPPVAATFPALGDNNTAIPPDTMGAVGPRHVMTTLNSQVRIQDRSGGVTNTVDLNSFWSSTGNPDAFDPRALYDPFNNRWILTAAGNGQSSSSVVLVGVSDSDDPTGSWSLYSVPADPNGAFWADYDDVGFNKNWIVVTANLFPVRGKGFGGVAVYAFDKMEMYTNTNGHAHFTMLTDTSSTAFSLVPATTYDNSLDTLYLMEDWDGTRGQLRISTVTGAIGAETLTTGTAFPTTTNLWDSLQAKDNLAPQLGSKHGIDLGDSRLLSCQYRNGALWAAQTIFLPFGTATRGAVQWWQVDPDGTVQQFGRIDDPAGGKFYGYPSLAVNASNDVLIGYSRFSSWQYASGNYSFRFGTDPANTLRADTVLKIGEGPYYVTDKQHLNRWGDFSSTVVDPVDDLTLWTMQEYAAAPIGNPAQNGSGQWGTWWGRVAADPSALKVAITEPADDMSYRTNAAVTITATNLETGITFSKVEFFANATKIGETNAAPYTIVWPSPANGDYGLSAIATDTLSRQWTSSVINVTVGDPGSPLGAWETKLSGFDKGTAYVTFEDDFTVSGYGMTAGSFGLFTISGNWTYNRLHQIVGAYGETLNGVDLVGGDFVARVQGGRRFQATVTPGAGKRALRLGGAPAAAGPNLTGSWTAAVKISGAATTENYQLTASAGFLNLFDLIGLGSTSRTGSVIVTRNGSLNMSTTNGVARSLAGRVTSHTGAAALTGRDQSGHTISLKMSPE